MHNNNRERIDDLLKQIALNIAADRTPDDRLTQLATANDAPAEESPPDPLGDLLQHVAEMKRHDEARAADATRNRGTSAAVTDLLKSMTKE